MSEDMTNKQTQRTQQQETLETTTEFGTIFTTAESLASHHAAVDRARRSPHEVSDTMKTVSASMRRAAVRRKMDADLAATQIQSIYRRNKTVESRRKEQAAATTVQAAYRGKAARLRHMPSILQLDEHRIHTHIDHGQLAQGSQQKLAPNLQKMTVLCAGQCYVSLIVETMPRSLDAHARNYILYIHPVSNMGPMTLILLFPCGGPP